MKKIDHEKIKKLMAFKPTLRDCAGFFNCSEDTVSRHVEKIEGMSFFDFREKYLGNTRIKLQQKAIQMALTGDRVMLIFALKNLCAWKDNPDFALEQEECTLEFVDG
jgi:AraC-like DNA-binding protein